MKVHQFRVFICIPLILFLSGAKSPAPAPAGTIAYVRGDTEIRLMNPYGSNDHQLWTIKGIKKDLGIFGLSWRPDGKELVFSSGHAATYSVYHADLYGISPDGSAFRKITNAPDKSEFSKFPQGSVTVTFRNYQVSYQQAEASAGVFIVYIAGAEPQMITLPPGASKTITFKSVADFGNKAQAIVAIWGKYRWFVPGTDVQAGKNIKAPDFTISGDGIDLFGAFRPTWKSDGSELSYRTGVCTINRIPANPPTGEYYYEPMFKGHQPFGSCNWDYGPTPATVDQIIYTENSGPGSNIYQIKEGEAHPGRLITSYSDIQYQILNDLHWLPDGNGLMYSTANLFRESANIFKYDFKSKQTTQVTKLENAFARKFSISPDGEWVIYERASTNDEDKDIDLWIQKINGGSSKLFIKNASCPAWGKQ